MNAVEKKEEREREVRVGGLEEKRKGLEQKSMEGYKTWGKTNQTRRDTRG